LIWGSTLWYNPEGRITYFGLVKGSPEGAGAPCQEDRGINAKLHFMYKSKLAIEIGSGCFTWNTGSHSPERWLKMLRIIHLGDWWKKT